MGPLTVVLIITAAILLGVYVSWRAGRLDRLHARVETARAALDAALVRRSSVALELAASGLLDPATSMLVAGAAHDARAAGAPDELAESDLTRALRAALGRRLVRLLRLAGGAPVPDFFEIDDSVVAGGGPGGGADMPRLTGGEAAYHGESP